MPTIACRLSSAAPMPMTLTVMPVCSVRRTAFFLIILLCTSAPSVTSAYRFTFLASRVYPYDQKVEK